MDQRSTPVLANDVRLGSLVAADPGAVIELATAVARRLADVIEKQALYKKIGDGKFVFVDGWTTLGAMLGVVPREVSVVEHEELAEFEATVELIRVSDGQVIGRASSVCGAGEERWADAPRYARRSMSITRATGKAFRLSFSWVMTLAGYAPTPAEEMDGGEAARNDHSAEGERPRRTAPLASSAPAATASSDAQFLAEQIRAASVRIKNAYAPADKPTLQRLGAVINGCYLGKPDPERDALRHAIYSVVVGKEVTSGKDLNHGLIEAMLQRWEDPGNMYHPRDVASSETNVLAEAYLIAKGETTPP
jgi:hypothetical protein